MSKPNSFPRYDRHTDQKQHMFNHEVRAQMSPLNYIYLTEPKLKRKIFPIPETRTFTNCTGLPKERGAFKQ